MLAVITNIISIINYKLKSLSLIQHQQRMCYFKYINTTEFALSTYQNSVKTLTMF